MAEESLLKYSSVYTTTMFLRHSTKDAGKNIKSIPDIFKPLRSVAVTRLSSFSWGPVNARDSMANHVAQPIRNSHCLLVSYSWWVMSGRCSKMSANRAVFSSTLETAAVTNP